MGRHSTRSGSRKRSNIGRQLTPPMLPVCQQPGRRQEAGELHPTARRPGKVCAISSSHPPFGGNYHAHVERAMQSDRQFHWQFASGSLPVSLPVPPTRAGLPCTGSCQLRKGGKPSTHELRDETAVEGNRTRKEFPCTVLGIMQVTLAKFIVPAPD